MAIATELTELQVKRWFANARTRGGVKKQKIPDTDSKPYIKDQSADVGCSATLVIHNSTNQGNSTEPISAPAPALAPAPASDMVEVTSGSDQLKNDLTAAVQEHDATKKELTAANVIATTLTVPFHPKPTSEPMSSSHHTGLSLKSPNPCPFYLQREQNRSWKTT